MTEHDHDVAAETNPTPNAAVLSLVGGFVGTVTGLKRNGVSGAVIGGLVGGTVGYVGGAALGDGGSATVTPPSGTEPISVGVSEDDEDHAADDESMSEDGTTDDDTGDDE